MGYVLKIPIVWRDVWPTGVDLSDEMNVEIRNKKLNMLAYTLKTNNEQEDRPKIHDGNTSINLPCILADDTAQKSLFVDCSETPDEIWKNSNISVSLDHVILLL